MRTERKMQNHIRSIYYIFIVFCCVTHHPKTEGLKQQCFILSHNSVVNNPGRAWPYGFVSMRNDFGHSVGSIWLGTPLSWKVHRFYSHAWCLLTHPHSHTLPMGIASSYYWYNPNVVLFLTWVAGFEQKTRLKLPDLLLWLRNLRTSPSFLLLYLVKTTVIPGSRRGDPGSPI